MIEQNDTYAIVIIGGMNPRIHHPSWYRLVGLFDEDEVEQATKSPSTLIMPMVSQIQTPKLTIVCQEDRWEIRTTETTQLDRTIHITCKLFDDILPHTPVAAAGFNFTYWKKTQAKDVSRYLASILLKMPLGLKSDHVVGADMLSLRRSFDDHTAIVAIRPVLDDTTTVALSYNYEYKFTNTGTFKLKEVIAGRYKLDKDDAEEQSASILEAINLQAGV